MYVKSLELTIQIRAKSTAFFITLEDKSISAETLVRPVFI